jgi:hypothetical protein
MILLPDPLFNVPEYPSKHPGMKSDQDPLLDPFHFLPSDPAAIWHSLCESTRAPAVHGFPSLSLMRKERGLNNVLKVEYEASKLSQLE